MSFFLQASISRLPKERKEKKHAHRMLKPDRNSFNLFGRKSGVFTPSKGVCVTFIGHAGDTGRPAAFHSSAPEHIFFRSKLFGDVQAFFHFCSCIGIDVCIARSCGPIPLNTLQGIVRVFIHINGFLLVNQRDFEAKAILFSLHLKPMFFFST